MSDVVEWELLTSNDDDHYEYTDRLQVPGGWIYRSKVLICNEDNENTGVAVAMVFVPTK